MPRHFLTAEWRKLAMANYVVAPDLLLPFLPKHTELDLWEGRCYVSLVGFMFQHTKLLGVPIPFHTDFEEVNLRFYVRYKEGETWKRGVVFVKEIVPKPALSFVANTLYGEHYETLPMQHSWQQEDGLQQISYQWKKSGKWQSIVLRTSLDSKPLEQGSEAEFITEHYWGYTRLGPDKTSEYQVGHPAWEVYEVQDWKIDVDFGLVYGAHFALLNQLSPVSVFLAEGSEIFVDKGKVLTA